MADAPGEPKITLYLLCLECNVFRDFTISRNASSYAFREAVRKVEPLCGSVWLVCFSSACLSMIEGIDDLGTPSAARSALREHFEPCKKGLKRLKHRNHEGWLRTVLEGDLHVVLRHDHYSSIAVYNTGTQEVATFEQVPLGNSVRCLLPPKADGYIVYQFPEGTDWYPEDELKAVIQSQTLEDLPRINQGALLNDLIPGGWRGENCSLSSSLLTLRGGDDILQPLAFSKRRRVYFDRTSPKEPSSEAKVGNFNKAQASEARRIHCGRPYQRSTPPTLLDETLCRLRCDVKSITPTPRDIQCFERLRATASMNFEDEAQRREEFTDILTNGGILPARASRGYIGSSGFHDDGDLRAVVLGIELVYYVQEVTHEIGTSNADPYVEAIHYWIENVRYFMDHTEDNPDEARFNLPAIIVLHFGPYLAIVAAVYGEEPNVEHLCCIPLHAHTTNEAELQGGERALAALRVAVHALRDRYPNLPFERTPRADFPFRDFYEDDDGKSHRFTYIEAIEEKRIFRVLHEDGTPLCVKFSKRYSAAAHKAAHSAGFAPALRAVNAVYDWTMIVMEDKSADYSNTMWDMKAAEWEKSRGRAKPTKKQTVAAPKPAVSLEEAQEQVKASLRLLHERGFVHGDVRDLNVLVRNKDSPVDSPDILIVDWDWAGVRGLAQYHRGINKGIARSPDALAGEQIKDEHDLWMAERLLE